MRYHALACDYDGTLAHDGKVDAATVDALRRLIDSGRRLILVTGRRLPELREAFPQLELCERVVAENGALLYTPATRREHCLAPPPPPRFVERLRQTGVARIALGRVIVATWEPHEVDVLEAIRDLGLEWQVIFNKGAVMALPSGITKATGLAAALRELGLSSHNAVAVGDAENDHHLLSYCECGVAVANAVLSLKEQADWVTPSDHGAGVAALIDRLIVSDLAELAPRLERHVLTLGRVDGAERRLHAYGHTVLLAGASGGGKSTFATAFLEQLVTRAYQYCVIDPEGDYGNLPGIGFGGPDQVPAIEQVMELLEDPGESCVVNLVALPLADRPHYFARLFAALLDLRTRTGRPHWIVVDECHHLLPASQHLANTLLASGLNNVLWITVYPDHAAKPLLALIDTLVAVGEAPRQTIANFVRARGLPMPALDDALLQTGEAMLWRVGAASPERIATPVPHIERRRHRRKYAQGELPAERSFYFRGPNGRLNLRAQNLTLFLQSAEGVDDDTWLYHLRRGDYSRWFREVIKDSGLADAVRKIEGNDRAGAQETRRLVREQIEERYSAPA